MAKLKFSFLIVPMLTAIGLAGCTNYTGLSSLLGSAPALENGAPFGAIAYSKSTQNWQIVSDQPSQLVAQNRALSGCKTKDCKILLVFGRGSCSSLSLDASKSTTAPYVSTSTDEVVSKNLARQACFADGGKDCKVTPSICN